MAELIIYAGRFDPEFLNMAHDAQDRNGASQPAAGPNGASQPAAGPSLQQQLKRNAATARMNYRRTCMLRRRLDQGEVDLRHLDLKQQRDLQTLEDGSLLRITKHAVAAYAHGALRHGDETNDIGGLF